MATHKKLPPMALVVDDGKIKKVSIHTYVVSSLIKWLINKNIKVALRLYQIVELENRCYYICSSSINQIPPERSTVNDSIIIINHYQSISRSDITYLNLNLLLFQKSVHSVDNLIMKYYYLYKHKYAGIYVSFITVYLLLL